MRRLATFLIVLLTLTGTTASAQGRGGRGRGAAADGGLYGLGALHFRPLGPEGNRVAAITGVPGDR